MESKTKKTEDTQSNLEKFVKSTDKKYQSNDPKQIETLNYLVEYIAGDLLPFSTVESENFRKFVEMLNPRFQMPSRKYLSTKLIQNKAKTIQQRLIDNLKKVDNICLTIDIWTNRAMKGFLGITAHFILDWKMCSAMLACKRFKGRHTAENILLEYEECINSFDISDKIFCVISDNASNMVKAFDFPMPGYIECDDQEQSLDEAMDDSNDTDDNKFEYPFPQHKRCYAHSLQLVIRDAFEECGQNIQKIISKVSKVVSFVRKSVIASEILEEEKRLQACNATRWNSQMHMIRSILNVPSDKLDKLDCASITAYDRKVLSEISTILKPFEDATVLVQKEKHVSGSMVIPITLGLKEHLQNVKSDYCAKFVSSLSESLSKRLTKYQEDDVYITSSILDTRFKLSWSKSEEVDDLTTGLKQKLSFVDSAANESEDHDNISPPTKKAKTDDFFSFLPRATPKKKRHTSGSTHCADDYLRDDCDESDVNPLVYWKENEHKLFLLSKLASKYLSVPASSAPVERLFSIAGKVFRSDRMRMTDDTFEHLMMIKCNKHI